MRSRAVFGLLAVLAGVCLATQGRINGQLGALLQDGVFAGLISNGLGLIALITLVLVIPIGRQGVGRLVAALRDGQLRWWQCLGGFAGAYLLFSQGVAITALGVAVFTVATVSGQLLSSLVVDRAGLGPAGPKPVTGWRLLGAGMAVGAVVLAVQGQLDQPAAVWLFVLPALAGFGLAWQSAVNGQVREAAGNALVAALVNFSAGTVLLVLGGVVDVLVRGWPASLPGEWWLYTGGAFGMVVIGSSAIVVRTVGVLLLSLCLVAGQLLGAVLLDLLVPARSAGLTLTEVLGTLITLVAVFVAALPSRTGSAKITA
ncbi:MAG: DMT family transporter [Kibdelosporangium sp.]